MKELTVAAGLTHWPDTASANYLVSLAYLVVLVIMIALEARVPQARPPRPESTRFNIVYTVLMLAVIAALKPVAMIVPLALTSALGAGWIVFAPGVSGWCASLLAILLLTDLLEYWFHRAQHAIPVLWRMHELHHTAEHFDVTLAYRQFWLEPLLKMAFVYPLVGLVLRPRPGVPLVMTAIILVFQHLAHMNWRFSPGRFALLVTHPQYHRLHHSRQTRNYNKNFCALLPLWDMLFGTLHRPAPGEFVDVGIESVEPPRRLAQAFLWPWRAVARPGGALPVS
jgi:sterol desaturase/sphingolipid hydroxylase (fatty acid hydroxylase superfamily)